jgi:hypothetical protein
MRRFIVVVILFAAMIAAFPISAHAQKPAWPTQNSHPIEANFGCLEMATTTRNIGILGGTIASATDLGDYLPSGCVGFEGRVTSGSMILGHATNLATGSFSARQGKVYASGSTILWTGVGANATFTGKLLAIDGATASLTIDLAW